MLAALLRRPRRGGAQHRERKATAPTPRPVLLVVHGGLALHGVRQRQVTHNLERVGVAEMLVLQTHKVPLPPAEHLEERHNKRPQRDRRRAGQQVDHPGESQQDVDQHRRVVHGPDVLERQVAAQQWIPRVRLQQVPVHNNVPGRGVDRVDAAKKDPEHQIRVPRRVVVPVPEVEEGVEHRRGVLERIHHVQLHLVVTVHKTAPALSKTQQGRHRSEHGRPVRVHRVARARAPVRPVRAPDQPQARDRPRQAVELVAQEEVPELDRGEGAGAKHAH